MYWIAVMIGFATLRFKEKKGRWPLMKAKAPVIEKSKGSGSSDGGSSSDQTMGTGDEKIPLGTRANEISPA